MVRLVLPDAVNALRLTAIAEAAFDGRESPWVPADFIYHGGPGGAAMFVDDDFEAGLLILRMAADEAEILNIGVIPAARGKGLGRALLDEAEAVASGSGIRRIFLEVAVDNAPARALYEGRGYAEVGRRKAYYLRPDGSRADALILAKPL